MQGQAQRRQRRRTSQPASPPAPSPPRRGTQPPAPPTCLGVGMLGDRPAGSANGRLLAAPLPPKGLLPLLMLLEGPKGLTGVLSAGAGRRGTAGLGEEACKASVLPAGAAQLLLVVDNRWALHGGAALQSATQQACSALAGHRGHTCLRGVDLEGAARRRRRLGAAAASGVGRRRAAGGCCRGRRVICKRRLQGVQVQLLPVAVHQAPHLGGALIEGLRPGRQQLPSAWLLPGGDATLLQTAGSHAGPSGQCE